MRRDQRKPTKAVAGPGGIGCPCCRRGSKHEVKVADRRIRRRTAKHQLKAELQG